MALQFRTSLRNALLDAIETDGGVSPTLEIRSGAVPANCAAADSGTVLATLTLPADWMSAASGGAKAQLGTWSDGSADATGTAAHFRFKAAGATFMQGTVTLTGGGGDITVDNTSFAAGQAFSITGFTLTAPGA